MKILLPPFKRLSLHVWSRVIPMVADRRVESLAEPDPGRSMHGPASPWEVPVRLLACRHIGLPACRKREVCGAKDILSALHTDHV